MYIYLNDIVYALSTALDAVEKELVGAETNHSKRVTYLAVSLGRGFDISVEQLMNISVAAALHDNALTEYIKEEKQQSHSDKPLSLGVHCKIGERNVSVLPFYQSIRNAILYHHEEASGNGPFGLKAEEIPLSARLIHFGDKLDVVFNLGELNEEKYESIRAYVKKSSGSIFSDKICSAFLSSFTYNKLVLMNNGNIAMLLKEALPDYRVDYKNQELIDISKIFAKIIDYKSEFTGNHSQGIAEKAMKMGEFYGFDENTVTKLYIAGALHDIGKLTGSARRCLKNRISLTKRNMTP